MINYRESLGGYHERMGRLALFDVFQQAANKKKKDGAGNDIDYYGLMLLTLLFFFECMLTRTKESGTNELAGYLKDTTGAFYVLSDEDYYDLAKQMVGILRPSGGKRNYKAFMNFETGQMDTIELSYLKVSDWDKEKNHQYYMLDEQGLELIFASKEYYNEFQISISQLILRKQLEKGEFGSALRQIDEMRISVNTMRDKIVTIKHDIQSNIVSDDVYDRYKTLINDINSRLNREHEEFEELAQFVQATKRHYEHDLNHHERELKAYQAIIRIDNELNDVHNAHSHLLEDSIELKTKALEAARESMYFVGLSSFNFNQEIVGKIMSQPLPFMEGRLFAKPFMKMSRATIWTPMALFARQQVLRKNMETKEEEFLDFSMKQEKEEFKVRKKMYRIIFSNYWEAMKGSKELILSEFIEHIHPDLASMKEVYEVAVIMHQLSPMDVDQIKKNPEHIFSEAMELIDRTNQMLYVEEMKEDNEALGYKERIQTETIKISNMSFRLIDKKQEHPRTVDMQMGGNDE